MDTNDEIKILDDYSQDMKAYHRMEEARTDRLIKTLGAYYQRREHEGIKNNPLQYIGFNQPEPKTQTNFDNLITLKIKDLSNQKEDPMQNIDHIKNARIRKDGRYEWRKMINGIRHYIVETDVKIFTQKISAFKKQLKKNANVDTKKYKESFKLFDRIKLYHERNIKSQVKTGVLKPESAKRYDTLMSTLSILKKDIRDYKKDDMIDFFNSLTHHRTGAYCYYLLKKVFADELEKGTIKINPIATLKNPFPIKRCVKKGSWIDLKGQMLLKQHLSNDLLSKEILFYLVTGCRLKEAETATIDFEKRIATIKRTKTENYGVQQTTIPLSKRFCDYIKDDWHRMFKTLKNSRCAKIVAFLKSIGINGKTVHSLRHTFSSNLYYLGVDPKKHQYLMGHSSIQQTYDTYTTLDISITKQDILDIWGDLYPVY